MTAANTRFSVAVYPGDGIGTEIMDTAEAVLRAVQQKTGGFSLTLDRYSAGAAHYEKYGEDIPASDFQAGSNRRGTHHDSPQSFPDSAFQLTDRVALGSALESWK